MRTQQEIVRRLSRTQREFLNFEPEVLIEFLSFKNARPFLKPDANPDEWAKVRRPYRRKVVLEQARVYMEQYGWPKCRDHRGISADRTIQKMIAWCWLAGEDEVLRKIHKAGYQNYGAPKLLVVCQHFGWPIPPGEDLARMAQGLACRPGCDQGCDR